MKYGEFVEPKPPKFNLILDPRPDKLIKLSEKTDFNKILKDKKTDTTPKSDTNTKTTNCQ